MAILKLEMKFSQLFGKWKKKLWAERKKTNGYFNFLYNNFRCCFLLVKISSFTKSQDDFTSLKTVTFGDESAVSPNRAASLFQLLQSLQFGLRLLALN